MRLFLILISSILITTSVTAQNEKREQIKALKASFITEKLDLSVNEAQLFWPIYNAYEKNMHNYKFSKLRKLRKNIRENYSVLTNNEADEYLKEFIDIENKIHTERNTLVSKLRSVISAKKIIALKAAEEDFNRKILDQFRKRRQDTQKQ